MASLTQNEQSHLPHGYDSMNDNYTKHNHHQNGGSNISNTLSCSFDVPSPEGQFSDADSIKYNNAVQDRDTVQVFSHSSKDMVLSGNNNTAKDNDDDVGRLKFRTMPRKKKLMLVFCVAANFTAGCAFSLLGPFFPQEASKKGMSLTLTGFVFSVFEFVIFLTSPLIGSYLTKLGPKFVFVSGVFVGGSCNILFGTLDKCPSGTPFIVMCIVCRMVEAMGFSAYVTSLLAIVSSEFPKDVATAISILETANGVGLMVGPAVGGWLYDLGGYGLPFYAIGTVVLINGAMIYTFIPVPEEIEQKKHLSKLLFLRSPMVIMGMATIACGCLGISFLDPMLANHLAPFGLSVSVIGLMFIIGPAIYTFFSPLWGYLSDRKGYYSQLMVMGLFVFGVGYLFIGPSRLLPFLPFELWTVTVGLVLTGAVFGCALFPSMKCMTIGSLELGFEENLDTYAVLAGLLNSMYSLGAFIGPMVGGVLADNLGYSDTFTIVGVLDICMSIILMIFFLKRRITHRNNQEKISLLHGNSVGGEDGIKDGEIVHSVKSMEDLDNDDDDMVRRRNSSLSNPFVVRSMSIPKGN